MKVLFISQYIPFQPKSGIEQRMQNLLRCLSRICNVTCVFFVDKQASETKESPDLHLVTHIFEKTEKTAAARYLQNLCDVIFLSSENKKHLESVIESEKPDIFWFEFGYLCHMARFLRKYKKPIIYSTHNSQFELDYNIWKDNTNRLYKIKMAPFICLYKLHEFLYLKLIDLIVCISRNDIEYYKKFVSLKKLSFLPFIFENKNIETIPPHNAEHPYICLVGSLASYQNYQAAFFMIDKIWPDVQKQRPDLHLYIVGGLPPIQSPEYVKLLDIKNKTENVILTGHVTSVIPYVKGALVNVAPLLLGSGIRTKIIESVACRTAVVSSSIGAEGLPFKDGESISIANEIHEFTIKILDLVDNREKCLAQTKCAYEIYLNEFSIDAGVIKLNQLFKSLFSLTEPVTSTPVYLK